MIDVETKRDLCGAKIVFRPAPIMDLIGLAVGGVTCLLGLMMIAFTTLNLIGCAAISQLCTAHAGWPRVEHSHAPL